MSTFLTRCCGGLLFIIACGFSQAGDLPLASQVNPEMTEWIITHQGKKLLVYSFAPGKFKPYVKELCTWQGENVLRDTSPDHPHHHALMYGITVNALNFWAEAPGSGIQKPVKTSPPEVGINAQGQPQAILRQSLYWVTPADAVLPNIAKAALLVEQRTLTLAVNEAQQEVALHWKSEFEVGPQSNRVTLTGTKYHGLGMRFQQELDGVAEQFNAGGKPDLSGGKQDATAHAWGSVFFNRRERPVTLVAFGHPGNARNPASYFSMRTPFAYMSVTQGLEKEPLVYRSGDRFQLNYLIVLYPAYKTPEAIRERGRQWEARKF